MDQNHYPFTVYSNPGRFAPNHVRSQSHLSPIPIRTGQFRSDLFIIFYILIYTYFNYCTIVLKYLNLGEVDAPTRVRSYNPTALYSDSSQVRHFVVPTAQKSDRSLFRQTKSLTAQQSDISIVRHLNSPTVRQSDTLP